jgi:hypothetical protein
MTDEEMFDISRSALEVTALFYYHLYRKVGAREIETVKKSMQDGERGPLSDNEVKEYSESKVT